MFTSDPTLFKAASERFLYYLEFERPKPFTKQSLRSYTFRIRALQTQWGELDVRNINKDKINEFRASLVKKGCSSTYMHAYLCLIRSFLRYCEEELGIEVMERTKIRLPPSERKTVIHVSQDVLVKLFNVVDKADILGLRFMAYISSLLDTGMRASEPIPMLRTTINKTTGRAIILGKGQKERMVFFREWSLDWIEQYIGKRTDGHPALFVTHKAGEPPKPVTYQAMEKQLNKYAKKAGVRVRLHDIRRTGATDLHDNGADMQTVQGWLGHEKIATTQKYVAMNWNLVHREVSQYQNYGAVEMLRHTGEKAKMWCRNGKWLNCISCKKDERPHLAKGFCDRCYIRTWRSKKESKPLQDYEMHVH